MDVAGENTAPRQQLADDNLTVTMSGCDKGCSVTMATARLHMLTQCTEGCQVCDRSTKRQIARQDHHLRHHKAGEHLTATLVILLIHSPRIISHNTKFLSQTDPAVSEVEITPKFQVVGRTT